MHKCAAAWETGNLWWAIRSAPSPRQPAGQQTPPPVVHREKSTSKQLQRWRKDENRPANGSGRAAHLQAVLHVCGGLAQTSGPRKKTASSQHATRQKEPSRRSLARQSFERDDQHQLATLQRVNAGLQQSIGKLQQSIGELQQSIGELQQRRTTRNTTRAACNGKSAYSMNGGLNRKTLNRKRRSIGSGRAGSMSVSRVTSRNSGSKRSSRRERGSLRRARHRCRGAW